MSTMLFDPDRWRKARKGNMIAARAVRDTLTNPEGYWKLDITDRKVREAVGFWVRRARHANDLALGRKPVIPNLVLIENGDVIAGAAYVGGVLKERPHP